MTTPKPKPKRDRNDEPPQRGRKKRPVGDPPPDEKMHFPPDPDRQRPRRGPRRGR